MKRRNEDVDIYQPRDIDDPDGKTEYSEDMDDFDGKTEYREDMDDPDGKTEYREDEPTEIAVAPTERRGGRAVTAPTHTPPPPSPYMSFTVQNGANLIGRLAAFVVVLGLGIVTVFSSIMGRPLYTYQRVERPSGVYMADTRSTSGKRKA